MISLSGVCRCLPALDRTEPHAGMLRAQPTQDSQAPRTDDLAKIHRCIDCGVNRRDA